MEFDTLNRLQEAVAYLREGKADKLSCGRHELFDGVYANVSQYQTQEDGVFEAHRKYIDVHYMIGGAERIEVADIRRLRVTKEYDEQADCVLGHAEGKAYTLQQGQFMVLFPEEAHRPGLRIERTCDVKKVVLKVPCGNV